MPDQYDDGGFSGGNTERPALKVVHKDKRFPGEHKAIIDKHTWEMTHAMLEANTRALRRSKSATTYPLRELIRCGYCGGGMTTVYTKKGNRRYIYLQCVNPLILQTK